MRKVLTAFSVLAVLGVAAFAPSGGREEPPPEPSVAAPEIERSRPALSAPKPTVVAIFVAGDPALFAFARAERPGERPASRLAAPALRADDARERIRQKYPGALVASP